MSARVGRYRRFAPWLVVVLIAGLVVSLLPSASAQSGDNASSAIPVNPDGSFVGSVANGTPIWFVFGYAGGNNQATITINYVPPDANQMDLQLYTGDPNSPRQEKFVEPQTTNRPFGPSTTIVLLCWSLPIFWRFTFAAPADATSLAAAAVSAESGAP